MENLFFFAAGPLYDKPTYADLGEPTPRPAWNGDPQTAPDGCPDCGIDHFEAPAFCPANFETVYAPTKKFAEWLDRDGREITQDCIIESGEFMERAIVTGLQSEDLHSPAHIELLFADGTRDEQARQMLRYWMDDVRFDCAVVGTVRGG